MFKLKDFYLNLYGARRKNLIRSPILQITRITQAYKCSHVLFFPLCTIFAKIMSQEVDVPQFRMPHCVVRVVILPDNFLFTSVCHILQDMMGGTLAVLQTETSQTH